MGYDSKRPVIQVLLFAGLYTAINAQINRRGVLGHGAKRGDVRRAFGQRARSFRSQRDTPGWSVRAFVLGPRQTAFDAELTAIVRELEILALGDRPGPHFRIFTDPRAAMRRLRSDNCGPRQFLARRGILLAQATVNQRRSPASTHWIPGHAGVEGNEMADLCAGKAVLKDARTGEETNLRCGVSLAFLKVQRSESNDKMEKRGASAMWREHPLPPLGHQTGDPGGGSIGP